MQRMRAFRAAASQFIAKARTSSAASAPVNRGASWQPLRARYGVSASAMLAGVSILASASNEGESLATSASMSEADIAHQQRVAIMHALSKKYAKQRLGESAPAAESTTDSSSSSNNSSSEATNIETAEEGSVAATSAASASPTGTCGHAAGGSEEHVALEHIPEAEQVAMRERRKASLPVYTAGEVAKHTTKETRIWVTLKGEVYDITDFLEQHPGGDKILMAKGGSVEPFWALYPVHYQSKVVPGFLDQYRIGRLDEEAAKIEAEKARIANLTDPFRNDPARHPALRVIGAKPFNAEAPAALIAEQYITPTDIWFVRNHHPVPVVDPETYKLEIGFEKGPVQKLSLEELKARYTPAEVTATIVCAGNRRTEFNSVEETDGLEWDAGALSNAVWRGAKLTDVMRDHGLTPDNVKEKGVTDVIFAGLDEPFDSSIPVEKAISPQGDVLLAYEMNGKPIPRDHGFPIRAVVPGHVGVRNVKWVKSVTFADHEATSVWQQGSPYKGFSPNVKTFKDVNPAEIPSVQTLPVQCAIVRPDKHGVVYPSSDGTVDVAGWAYSGDGKGIVRVDVTADNGETWTTAKVTEGPSAEDVRKNRAWAWSLWTAEVPVPKTAEPGSTITVAAKAVDTGYNVQPERMDPIWNRRGILNNSWFKTPVVIDKEWEKPAN